MTVGNYFKHLLKYSDGRFARHPHFHYLALNTEMRWHVLQTGKVYIKQHPNNAKLSLDNLKELVQSGGNNSARECCPMLGVSWLEAVLVQAEK